MAYSEFDEIEIEVEVEKFNGEYADCGSHRIRLKLSASRNELKALQKQLERRLVEYPNHKAGEYELIAPVLGYRTGTKVVLYSSQKGTVRVKNGGKSILFDPELFKLLGDKKVFKYVGAQSV